MKWASAISERPATDGALAEAADRVRAELGVDPDLVVAFLSPHHTQAYRELPARLALAFPRALVVGCAASGVIGAGHEVEERPALSLTAASLPGVELTPMHLDPRDLERDLSARIGLSRAAEPHFLVLADPFTFDADALVAGLDRAYPAGRKVGGLASGGRSPGGNVLFLGREVHRSGAVCVAMTGNITVDTIVAQGCRPIGRPMVVTRGRDNLIEELDKQKPAEVLHELFDGLDERDQTLFRHSLFVGIEMRESQIEVSINKGEFLVRNLVGMDPTSGALAVGAHVQPWQVVQFLLRDARTAAEDLTALLTRYRTRGAQPAGALLFSCLGRGQHLYGRPDHDTNLFAELLGSIPLGGFFCNGEIGPVGGSTFLHGYTSAFGLFRSRSV
jgi:small ligand-binding sensory domain FIST